MSKSKKVKIPEESDEESEIESEINELLYEEDEDIEEEDEEPNDCLVDKMIEDDNDYFENMIDSEIKEEVEEKLLELNERISSNRLTKYEMVRILGERTKQLTLGAKPMVKNYQSLSYEKIAEEELKLNMIPYKIKRLLPNHKYEIWTLDELMKDHLLSYLE